MIWTELLQLVDMTTSSGLCSTSCSARIRLRETWIKLAIQNISNMCRGSGAYLRIHITSQNSHSLFIILVKTDDYAPCYRPCFARHLFTWWSVKCLLQVCNLISQLSFVFSYCLFQVWHNHDGSAKTWSPGLGHYFPKKYRKILGLLCLQ